MIHAGSFCLPSSQGVRWPGTSAGVPGALNYRWWHSASGSEKEKVEWEGKCLSFWALLYFGHGETLAVGSKSYCGKSGSLGQVGVLPCPMETQFQLVSCHLLDSKSTG